MNIMTQTRGRMTMRTKPAATPAFLKEYSSSPVNKFVHQFWTFGGYSSET